MPELKFKSTADIKVPKRIIDQVIGQDDAAEIMKKAAQQRRHVLLIGEPGTGKSMLGMALAELIPMAKLVDIISFFNPNDENAPLIRTIPAGKGRELVARARIQETGMLKHQTIIFIVIAIIVSIIPYYLYSKKIFPFDNAIIYAASMITSMVFILGIILFLNIGKRMGGEKPKIPKLIVDNYKRKQASFNDATGAHAGALLGDVLHDPFQSLNSSDKITIIDDKNVKKDITANKLIDGLFLIHKEKILKKKEKNYEAVFLPKNGLFVLGEMNGSVSPVEVFSSNRYDYTGKMIKLTTSENKELIVTLEHKIAIQKNGKIAYVEAKDIKVGDDVISKSEDIIIDEQDIIKTYSKDQQALAKSYYDYLELRKANPCWGYKRIATKLGVSYGRTRWWWEKDSAPVPVQTVGWLKSKGLLPLKIDNPKLPLIAKIVGATFGDGGIFENLNGIFLSSSEKEAVEEFGRDLEKIFKLNKNENSRIIEGGEYGHSWCYQNTNRNGIRFFIALGVPKGNKTNLELKIPEWISLKENLEDEFFGSLFGGELGTPIMHKTGNHLTNLELGITGNEKLNENRYEFLSNISAYLNKKNVISTSIYKRKLGKNSIIFRLQIGKKFDNILHFMINIKINYCKYKVQRLYAALGEWAKLKKEKYYELIQRGYGSESAMNLLNLSPNSLYLLLNDFGPKQEATT